ncbi:HEAT repeat-containing protein [Methylobacterium sp. 174MFSha1.1]|uniref:HEAT repeat domain-containing protein n=1 Tax=Methylobacterium sp. 174MFSha1.1 TaxID=1502749 RepID=UPI0008DEED89|nr:HEAT repeat domain-containing protein [Methylobacterium sp. 174MFSha1.1]SFU75397.1 HEAT repeat-containing protein [Methylobacterium sp. 174MFSha1.1]
MALVRRTPLPAPQAPPEDPRDALDAASAAARREAAHRLSLDPEAVGILAARLAHEPENSVREAILAALGRLGTDEAVGTLFSLLGSEDVWLRNAAIETLQAMDAAVLGALESGLDHPDSDRRIFAVNVLVSLRHPEAAALALRTLARDAHVNVCAACLDVLAEIGTPEMIPSIDAAVARFPDEPFLRFAAKAAKRRIA